MSRLRFGVFHTPHQSIGEHPMLQYLRDLDPVASLMLWVSMSFAVVSITPGWQSIASPEVFLATAAADHMSAGRAIFGSGRGARGVGEICHER